MPHEEAARSKFSLKSRKQKFRSLNLSLLGSLEAQHEARQILELRAERDWFFNELITVLGVIRRRRIVDGEEHAGDGLEKEEKYCGKVEHIDPASVTGNRLVWQDPFDRLEVQAAVKPCVQGASVYLGWLFDAHSSLYNWTRFRPLRLAWYMA